jgi:Uncharacterised nucleotidyltransferase
LDFYVLHLTANCDMKLDAISMKEIDRSDSLRPEVELLLCCSHTQTDPARQARIHALVQQELDWEYILERSSYHGILPLLDRQFQSLTFDLSKTSDLALIPPAIIATIHSNFNKNLHGNLRLTVELLKLSRLFEQRSIPMLSFKGAVLAQAAYGNVGLRQFVDIDILVPEADVARASELLVSQGYQPQFNLTAKQQFLHAKIHSEQWFWHEEKQVCIDLHWSVLRKHYTFTPTEKILWAKLDRVNFAEQSVATLSPEHLLLFLCAHGSKHNWSRLAWICDLAELLRVNRSIDWEYIHNLTGQFGTQRMLYLGLYLAHKLLDADLPPSVLAKCDLDRKLPILAARIQASLFQPPAAPADSNLPDMYHEDIYRQTMVAIPDRIWYWIDSLFTPTPLEWEIIDLPQALFPLYYGIRSIRLVLKHIWKLEI